MAKRDDFSQKVKDTLAKRVGYKCSNPNCNKETSGPHSDLNKSLSTGVAAHITAAAPDGPRYDPTLSAEQRKSIDNGIWLCEYCARLIDKDPTIYPVVLLCRWKMMAEAKMFQLQHLNFSQSDKDNLELKNSIKTMNSLIKKICDIYEYFFQYYEMNFSHFRSHFEAMDSLNRHFELHKSSLENILELDECRYNLMNKLSEIELDLSDNISDLIKEFDYLGNFTYQSDQIGFYNNYYEQFFLNVINNHAQRKTVKDKIIQEIKNIYQN